MKRTIAVSIIVFIIFILVIVALSYPYLSSTLSKVQKVTGNAPQSTLATPLFTATITPPNQTVVNALGYGAAFNLMMTGSTPSIFTVYVHTGCPSQYTHNNEVVEDYYSTNLHAKISGSSIVYSITGVDYSFAIQPGTYHAYVIVVDNLGHSYSSNSVDVTVT
jgi:hypothetical protein